MTSAESFPSPTPLAAWADAGLLSPGHAGTPVEAATGDLALLQGMLDAEAALTRAQAALGHVPAMAAAAVTAAARAERFDPRSLAVRARAGGNPVIPLVADLTAAVPAQAAPYVHRGATSQDIVDTALMLVATRSLRLLVADLHHAASSLAALAATHRTTAMPGRTLTQHAVPTTFGLKAAGWRSLLLDAADRLTALRLPAQLGGAAGTLAAFELLARSDAPPAGNLARPPAHEQPQTQPTTPGGAPSAAAVAPPAGQEEPRTAPATVADPALPPPVATPLGPALLTAYAAETGLPAPDLPWHTLRTPIADLATALAFTSSALGKIAADVLLLSRTEIGELAEGEGGGSSAMPHKANPVRATLLAASARRAPALAATLLGSLVAEDERPAGAWHAEWHPLRELLRLTGGAARTAAELVDGLRVLPDRMLENLHLTRGLIVSERIAAELAVEPLPEHAPLGHREAKDLLIRAAHRATAEDLDLAETLVDDPALQGRFDPDRLRRMTDPTAYLGSAAALVDRALTRAPQPFPRNPA